MSHQRLKTQKLREFATVFINMLGCELVVKRDMFYDIKKPVLRSLGAVISRPAQVKKIFLYQIRSQRLSVFEVGILYKKNTSFPRPFPLYYVSTLVMYLPHFTLKNDSMEANIKKGCLKPNRPPAKNLGRLRTFLSLALIVNYLKRYMRITGKKRKGRRMR